VVPRRTGKIPKHQGGGILKPPFHRSREASLAPRSAAPHSPPTPLDEEPLHKAPENCGPTANGLKKLDVWLGDGKWDAIHFNFGIHDRNTAPADYEQRLEQIATRLEKAHAKLIWASTTPIPTDEAKKQTAESIVERNAIAARLMQQHGIAIDDLFTAITPHLAEMQNPNDVHFDGKGYDFLGQQVAASIRTAMK